MRKRFLEWLISWLLPGFHLHRDPVRKEKDYANQMGDEGGNGSASE